MRIMPSLRVALVLVSAEGGVSFDGPHQVSQLLQWTARRPALAERSAA